MVDLEFKDTTSWIPSGANPPDSGINLFCFPYSGASASIYHSWVRSLPAPLSVFPVELPGHGRRLAEPLQTSLKSLVETIAAGLLPHLKSPFAFFGHSMGALLSFELSRYLRAHDGLEPRYLFLSGHPAPQLRSKERPVSSLTDVELINRLRELNGTSEEVLACPELRDLLLPILRADFSVCDNYQFVPGEPLNTPMTVIGGLQDPFVSNEDLRAWKEHTRGSFQVSFLPGDHFFLKADASRLLERLARDLFKVL
ncbi:MAG TPA: alpha/beta fold hydrolase [Anaerolineaceae bacterium]|nr:alpha/beta fold hydrolase [Anaerolineaceae bacterium]